MATLLNSELTLWTSCMQRSLSQLHSLVNLVEQLEAVRGGKLGVLNHYHLFASLLETKLIQSMENALNHIVNEEKEMFGVVRKLKKYAKESQVAFEKSVRTRGLELSCTRTAEEFSLGDYANWLWQLHAAYRASLDSKSTSLKKLRYTVGSVREICYIWEKEPYETKDILDYIRYSTKDS